MSGSGRNGYPERQALSYPPVDGAEEGMDLRDLMLALGRRWWLVVGMAFLTLAAAGYLVSQQSPQYRATAVFQFTDSHRALTGGLAGSAVDQFGSRSDPLVTQLEVLRSRTVLGRVVDREGLRLRAPSADAQIFLTNVRVDPASTTRRLEIRFGPTGVSAHAAGATAEGAYGDVVQVAGIEFAVSERPQTEFSEFEILHRDDAIDRTAARLRARMRDRTSIVDVEYTATDPYLAQRVVNAAIQEFAAHNAALAQQETRRRRAFLADQLAQIEMVLTDAEGRLAEFRSQEGVYSSREQLSAQHSGLMNLEVRREELAADRRMYGSLLGALGTSSQPEMRQRLQTLVAAPGIAENAVVSQLYSELRAAETERDDLVTRGASASHPDVQRLETRIMTTREALTDAVRSHIAGVDARLQALDDLRTRLAADLAPLPAVEAQEARLIQEVEMIRRQATQLREEYQRAGIAEAVETGQVEIVDLATRPGTRLPGRHARKLLLGLLVGLMLGAGGALGIDQFDRRIRSRQDAETATGVPVLSTVPHFRVAANGRNGARPLLTLSTRSAASETFRSLQTMLHYTREERLSIIGVTSAEPGEGKSVIASNLAVMMTTNETRVLLVDADFPRPVLHSVFDLPRSPGLSDLLVGKVTLSDAVHYDDERRIHVLPAGSAVPASAELLAGKSFRSLIQDLRDEYDVVILDTPPVLAVADGLAVAGVADGMLMVVRADMTDRFALREAAAQVRGAGGDIVATILNDVRSSSAEGRYYRGTYYYKDYHQEPPTPTSRLRRMLRPGG